MLTNQTNKVAALDSFQLPVNSQSYFVAVATSLHGRVATHILVLDLKRIKRRINKATHQFSDASVSVGEAHLIRFVNGGGSGASEEVRVKNREALYGLSRRLHKAAKKAPASLPLPQQQTSAADTDKRQRQPHSTPVVTSPSQSGTPQRAQHASKAQNGGVGSRGRPSRFAAGSADAAERLPAGNAEMVAASIEAPRLADVTSEAVALQNGVPACAKKRQKKKHKQQAAEASLATDADVDALPAGKAAAVSSTKGSGNSSGSIQNGVPLSTRKQDKLAASTAGSQSASTPGSQSVSQRHSRSKSSAAAAAVQLTAAVAATATAGSPSTPVAAAAFPGLANIPMSSQRKSVQFLMKKNLYFEHGGE